jgi:peptide/nickel transport system permease protein
MSSVIGRRLVALLAVLLGLSVIVFALQAIIPADPARAIVGASASPAVVAAKTHELGYDKPLPAQFASFLRRMAHGDLQESLRTRNPVADDLRTFAPATLELALVAAALAAALGVGLGLLLTSGWRAARAARLLLIGGASVPSFLVALLAILLFYSALHLLPASGRVDDKFIITDGPTRLLLVDSLLHGQPNVFFDAIKHLIMPAFTLALVPALAIARTLDASLTGPTFTMGGLQFGLMLGGVVVVEQIFAWPGLGLYLDQSIGYSDFPAITGTTILLGTAYVIVNFLVDLAQAWADPRIRTV